MGSSSATSARDHAGQDPAASGDTEATASGTGRRRKRRGARAAGWLASLVTALFCAFSAWTYAQAGGDDDLAYARARDDALAAARTHVARLNSMDGDHVEDGLRKWRQAATGPLRDELRRTGAKSAEVLQEEGTTTRGTVTDAAVTQLDERAGTAKVIAMVRVAVEPSNGEATTDRKRFEAGLARTADGWKLTSLQAVPAQAN